MISEDIFSINNLHKAYLKCRKGKRGKVNTRDFEVNLYEKLNQFSISLQNGTYQPSRSVCFYVQKPKLREVFASDFKDRVVHRLIIMQVGKYYELHGTDSGMEIKITHTIDIFIFSRMRGIHSSYSEKEIKGEFMKQFIILFLCLVVSVFGYGNYTDNGNGTITDNLTGLVWQKCSMGQNNDGTCSGGATTATWVNAISYCENLVLGGQSDWRLPNVRELESLVDFSRVTPSINNIFPATVAHAYWSSSTRVNNTNNAWYVVFNNGLMSYYNKNNSFYVRCVRGG